MRPVFFVMLVVLGLSACSLFGDETSTVQLPNPKSVTGTVWFLEFEGGFYGILADDHIPYLPLNLDDSFCEDGVRVIFSGSLEPDTYTVYQWGHVIRLNEVHRLGR